jgi:hypothetical protein
MWVPFVKPYLFLRLVQESIEQKCRVLLYLRNLHPAKWCADIWSISAPGIRRKMFRYYLVTKQNGPGFFINRGQIIYQKFTVYPLIGVFLGWFHYIGYTPFSIVKSVTCEYN